MGRLDMSFTYCTLSYGLLISVRECSASEFTCNDGTCLDRAQVCDGLPDCSDSEDEQNCGMLYTGYYVMRSVNITAHRNKI